MRLPMLVMLKQNLRTSRQVYFQIAHHHNPRIDPERHPKMFLLSTMNLNSVKLQRFVQSEVFVTNVAFKQCHLCVLKVLYIHVTGVTIRQHDKTILRDTNNLNIKV